MVRVPRTRTFDCAPLSHSQRDDPKRPEESAAAPHLRALPFCEPGEDSGQTITEKPDRAAGIVRRRAANLAPAVSKAVRQAIANIIVARSVRVTWGFGLHCSLAPKRTPPMRFVFLGPSPPRLAATRLRFS